jgi:predicted porin
MSKRIVSMALACACALPPLAQADSSFTISGFFDVGIENLSIGNANPARANTSELRMFDDSSRIDFNVKEDLGGGLAAIGQLDLRTNIPQGTISASGNDWVGLKSDRWGEVVVGRSDLHYFYSSDMIADKGPQDARSISLLSYVSTGAAIANDTRTPNVVRYSSPTWGLFDFVLAYSTDAYGDTGSMTIEPTDTNQNAYAWNFAPQLHGASWTAGYSYWKAVAPAAATTAPNQRGDRLWGDYRWGGWTVGLTLDRSELTAAAGGATLAKRDAWSIPIRYVTGPHTVYFHYTVAQDDDVLGSGTGAHMGAIGYAYSLSKLTSLGLTYARINNDAHAAYNLYNSVAGGTSDAAISPGEDPSIVQFNVRHAF